MQEHGQPHHVLSCRHPRHLPDLIEEAVRRAGERDGIVVAAGGDGTIRTVAQRVLAAGLRFGILPMGTFNYFARDNNLPQDPVAAVEILMKSAQAGDERAVQVGQLNDQVFLVRRAPPAGESGNGWRNRMDETATCIPTFTASFAPGGTAAGAGCVSVRRRPVCAASMIPAPCTECARKARFARCRSGLMLNIFSRFSAVDPHWEWATRYDKRPLSRGGQIMNFSSSSSAWIARNRAGIIIPEWRAQYRGTQDHV